MPITMSTCAAKFVSTFVLVADWFAHTNKTKNRWPLPPALLSCLQDLRCKWPPKNGHKKVWSKTGWWLKRPSEKYSTAKMGDFFPQFCRVKIPKNIFEVSPTNHQSKTPRMVALPRRICWRKLELNRPNTWIPVDDNNCNWHHGVEKEEKQNDGKMVTSGNWNKKNVVCSSESG